MLRYRIESEGVADIEVELKTEARLEARARLRQGRSSLIFKINKGGEYVVGLFGVLASGAFTEIEDPTVGFLHEQTIRKHLPRLADCPPRLRRDYPGEAPFRAVRDGLRLRPSGLSARLLRTS